MGGAVVGGAMMGGAVVGGAMKPLMLVFGLALWMSHVTFVRLMGDPNERKDEIR